MQTTTPAGDDVEVESLPDAPLSNVTILTGAMARADRARWAEYASCANLGNDAWFNGRPTKRLREACEACPVHNTCLAYALCNEATLAGCRAGFWAGTLPGARDALARGRSASDLAMSLCDALVEDGLIRTPQRHQSAS